MLNGEAKAMVVTSGRLDAVRFKQAMDKLIRESGIKGVGVVVAFSGEVIDPDAPGMKYTETSMNPELNGMDIPLAIKKPQFNLLIVANKFQTGYDEPLLCGMYVDKQLSGVATVQTFSRLNRTHEGKERTYILDFKNKPETVQKDFDPYYKVTELTGVTDPNLIFELQSKLDARQIYTTEEVISCAKAYIEGSGNAQAEIIAAVKPGADRFRTKLNNARDAKDEEEVKYLEMFRKQCTAFITAYEFLAQVYTYKDSSLEKLYIYLKALVGMIRDDVPIEDANIIGLKLEGVVPLPSPPVSIELEGEKKLKPLIDVGSQSITASERTRIEEILKRINELFDGNLTEDQKKLFTFGIVNTLANNKEVLSQAKANDQATFAEGDFKEKVREAIAAQVEGHKDMGRQILSKEKLELYVKLLAELAHGRMQERAKELGVDEGI
jgi:type I restriction enzyme, R subunit